ncbi:MAG: sigma-70 family RNA polymerase sigma factor, partial [Tepidisphaeraceae bacterium]
MPRFRIDNIAALARQMAFTPADTRLAQLARTEDLLHTLDAAKAYPLEFVVFRITGYRPKSIQSSLLTGLALQHDLGLLIETVSESLDLKASDVPEPVLAIEDVTERFNVTAKTIQRWRRRGLPARRFIFSDGRRRVGFLVSSVERFLSERGELVARGTNFSQVDDVERSEILRRARRLSLSCQCCHNEISRRVARRFNRSPLTILHTIRRHDELDPDHAIFASSPTPIGDDDRTRIVRAFRKGVPVGSLARRFCRTRSQVYRVILDERLSRLTNRKVKFIDDPLYHQPEAAEVMEHLVRAGAEASESATDQRVPRDLPGYLQELYRTPLLSAALERALFLKFNFHKYQYVQARRKLEPQFARARDLNVLDAHLQRAIDTKNAIVRANLRLVVSIARRHLRPGLSLTELIS